KMRFSDIEANAIQCYLLCRRRRLNLGPDALLSAGRLSCTDRHGDVLPCCDNVGEKFSMICGEGMFEVKKAEIDDLAMDRDETLALPGRLEAHHTPFPSSHGKM